MSKKSCCKAESSSLKEAVERFQKTSKIYDITLDDKWSEKVTNLNETIHGLLQEDIELSKNRSTRDHDQLQNLTSRIYRLSGWKRYNETLLYKIIKQKATFAKAKRKCISFSGRLAAKTITKSSSDIMDFKRLKTDGVLELWIGYSWDASSKQWVWADDLLTSENRLKFTFNEPADESGCLRWNITSEIPMRQSCVEKSQYICERDI